MLIVETIAKIRRLHFTEGKGIELPPENRTVTEATI